MARSNLVLRLLIGKVEKVHLSVAIVLFDTIVRSDATTKKFRKSRLFGDLGQRSVVRVVFQQFQRPPFETTGPVCIKFHMQLPSKQEKFFVSRSHG